MLFILYKYAYMKLILIVYYKYNNTYKESSRFLNFKHDVVIFCYIYIYLIATSCIVSVSISNVISDPLFHQTLLD